MFIQQMINALSLGSVYALFALGFTLIFGVLGVLNLAHGAVLMIGAYVALICVQSGMNLIEASLISMIFSGLLGSMIDYLVLRPLRKRNAPHLAPMIATIGVGILLTSIMQGIFGAEIQRFPLESFSEETIHITNSLQITSIQLSIIIISLILMISLLIIMKKTKLGQAMRAVAENTKASYLLGIDVEKIFLSVSFFAGVLGGVAGILIGISFNAISPTMGHPIMPKGIAVIILGGMGDIRGAMIGGLFLGFVEVMSVAYLSSDYRDAISFGLLFLILLVRPSGLFGQILERKA